ncbi:hypothetical protein, partial [Mesorhizobium sp. M8A.F.Ca.ET.167.01.1.1]|uniref:hypothetical protein n=1 Tax=Mesorhizobium sp. M8A.F.Ca.ET.167.01.1.1 TaxID=2563961 RepID=UPI001AEDC5A0
HGYPGTVCPEHFDPPAHRRVGYVMHKVQDMQHAKSTAFGPATQEDAITAFAASQHFWCSEATTAHFLLHCKNLLR